LRDRIFNGVASAPKKIRFFEKACRPDVRRELGIGFLTERRRRQKKYFTSVAFRFYGIL
jgi:hypothetical protein